jgi:spore coat polysaccharide biosynthesis protein SpsF
MTFNSHIFIPVRLSSQRLPSKHLKHVNGEIILLKLIKRLKKCQKISKIIVCTTTDPSDDPLIEILDKESILYFRGHKTDIIQRFLDAANFFNTDLIIDVEGDKIYTDPYFVDNVVDELEKPNVDFVIGNDSHQEFNEFNNFISGFIPAGIKTMALKKLCNIKKSENTETGYREFFTKTKIFNCKYLVPESLQMNSDDVRLTLDYEEDLQLANKIFMELGDNFSSKDIVDLLKQKPSLIKITKPVIKKWNEHYSNNLTDIDLE